jgi:HEAT repeat protein
MWSTRVSCEGRCPGWGRIGLVILGSGGLFLSGCTLTSQSVRSTRASGPVDVVPSVADEAEAEPVEETMTAAEVETVEQTTTAPEVETVVVRAEAPTPVVERPRVRSERAVVETPPVRVIAPVDRARLVLEEASNSEWPLLRANALEMLATSPDLLRPLIAGALEDENRGVRFVAVMACARAKLPSVDALLEPMLEDPSLSVRAATIYALSQYDDPVNPSPLAEMVQSDDPEVRGNAFMVLGLLGDPSARPLIRSMLGRGLGLVDPARVRLIDLQGAAALVRLGDQQEIEPIRAALFAPTEQAELTALSIQLISQLGDEGARQMLVRLVEAPSRESRPAEIRLAAAQAIAILGGRDPEPLLRLASEYIESPRAEIRAQVASLLGEVNDATARGLLSDLMEDPNPIVRVSAAGSCLKLGGDERTAVAPVH